MLKTYRAENFKTEVLESGKLILVDFWAQWCSPCRMLTPILTEIAGDVEYELEIGKVNVDEEQGLALEYKITAIPTMLLFKDGELKEKLVGLQSRQEIEETIFRVLGVD